MDEFIPIVLMGSCFVIGLGAGFILGIRYKEVRDG
jgi:hypothetical protein